MAFVIIFGGGYAVLGLGIVRAGALPRVLGWVLLVLGIGVGLVAYPLQYFRVAGASVVVLAAMMVFFLWLIATESRYYAGALRPTACRWGSGRRLRAVVHATSRDVAP